MRQQYIVTHILWFLLVVSAIWGAFSGEWSIVLVSVLTLGLSLTPLFLARRTKIRLPAGFVACVVFFAFATLFLGEVGGFYERFWWWDVFLHTGSAISFGMIGTILVLILLRGDKLSASPFLMSVFAFSFAVAIGVFWEIFEFGMDRLFGLNMQKSGLVDTMFDLIVDCIGAFFGALAGFAYIKGKENGFLSYIIAEFVRNNKRLFRKHRE